MINPDQKDIGGKVQYKDEFGVITSFTDSFVYVRYEKQHPSANGQATKREDLTWVAECRNCDKRDMWAEIQPCRHCSIPPHTDILGLTKTNFHILDKPWSLDK